MIERILEFMTDEKYVRTVVDEKAFPLKSRPFTFNRGPFTHFRIPLAKDQEFLTAKAALAALISSFRSASKGTALIRLIWRKLSLSSEDLSLSMADLSLSNSNLSLSFGFYERKTNCFQKI